MTMELISDGRYCGIIEYRQVVVQKENEHEEIQTMAILKDLDSLSRADRLILMKQRLAVSLQDNGKVGIPR